MSKKVDPYAGFSRRYDLSFGPFGGQDPHMAEFFHKIFSQNNIHMVLDCACGTGRHIPLFHSIGCHIFGSDISESMLAQARINLSGLGLEVSVFQADFRNLPVCFQQSIDAVVCLGAITFMEGEAEFLRAFKSMAQVLHPGGILVVTIMPADRQWKEKPRFILNSSRLDFSRIFAIDYYEDKARFNILDIQHSGEKSELKVWSTELYPLLQDDLERLLLTAGFRVVDLYEAYDFSPYNRSSSDNLIAVAHR